MTAQILTVGHTCIDIVYHVDSLPNLNEKIPASKFEIEIGGNAANVAAALCDFGSSADLCTVLGSWSHPFTRVLISLLTSKGIGTKNVEYEESVDSSVSTIMITPNGDRTIINYTDIKLQSAVSIPANVTSYKMILGDSYRLPMVSKVFQQAKSAGIKTMLDVDLPIPLDNLPACDYVWFSGDAMKGLNSDLPKLQSYFGGIVGVTMGSLPVRWVGPDHTVKMFNPKPITVKNTLGAGDVFRARFAHEICKDTPIDIAVECACESAGEYISIGQLSRLEIK